MGSFVSYPKFVSPPTKTLHPDTQGVDLTLSNLLKAKGIGVGASAGTPVNGQILISNGSSAFFTAYDSAYRQLYIDALEHIFQISGVTKAEIGASGIKAGSYAPGSIVNADVSASAAISPTKLQPHEFLALVNANTSNDKTGDGTPYVVIYDTKIFDASSAFSTGSGVYTAPETGRYQFNVFVNTNNVGSQTAGVVELVTSNRAYRIDTMDPGGGYSGGVTADMDAGDIAFVRLTMYGSTKTVGIQGNGTADLRTHFSGQMVG